MRKLALKKPGLFMTLFFSFHLLYRNMRQKALTDGTPESQNALADGTPTESQNESQKNESQEVKKESPPDKSHAEMKAPMSPVKPKSLFNVGLEKQQSIVEAALESRADAKDKPTTTKGQKAKKEKEDQKKTKTEKKNAPEKKTKSGNNADEGLKMDRKNCHSRAYHKALNGFVKKGMSNEKAKEKAAIEASKELERLGFEPSGMAGKMVQKKPAAKKK